MLCVLKDGKLQWQTMLSYHLASSRRRRRKGGKVTACLHACDLKCCFRMTARSVAGRVILPSHLMTIKSDHHAKTAQARTRMELVKGKGSAVQSAKPARTSPHQQAAQLAGREHEQMEASKQHCVKARVWTVHVSSPKPPLLRRLVLR